MSAAPASGGLFIGDPHTASRAGLRRLHRKLIG
jgi:hypothetical protein